MTEPVALEDIKRHLVLDQDATEDDAYLASLITAARSVCELRTNRSLVGKDALLVLPGFPRTAPGSVALPFAGVKDVALDGGIVSVFEIRYYDAAGMDQVLDGGAVHASLSTIPALLRPVSGWPDTADRPDAVRISYTISPIAADQMHMVRQAIRLIVGHWYANREAVSLDARSTPVEVPLAVTWLLAPLRVFASS